MKFEFTPNGNLRIVSEPGDADLLLDIKSQCGENDITFLSELLEQTGWAPNGQLMQIWPEDVAALTDSPILTDDMSIEDDGSVSVPGRVWWYPNYALSNWADVLLEEGAVVFQLGASVDEPEVVA